MEERGAKRCGSAKGNLREPVVASKTGEGAALLASMGIAATITASTFATSDYGESWKAIRNGIPIRRKRARGSRASAEHEPPVRGDGVRTVGIVDRGRTGTR